MENIAVHIGAMATNTPTIPVKQLQGALSPRTEPSTSSQIEVVMAGTGTITITSTSIQRAYHQVRREGTTLPPRVTRTSRGVCEEMH